MLVVTSFVGNPSVISFQVLSLLSELGLSTSCLVAESGVNHGNWLTFL
jgi:hypothetical protein